ncbi:MAG TPA: DNA adenine methylase [Verrucomicrobiae bacterium]|nr:DNA adenine methylase [Verrucomicrobiae bacterium]
MGSKRAMLANGLGDALRTHLPQAGRFADLFAGSSAVSWFVAQNSNCEVFATDLQQFAVSLAEAVISRNAALGSVGVWSSWSVNAASWLSGNALFKRAEEFDAKKWGSARCRIVDEARVMCSDSPWPITRAYGGHYFSPKQALSIDALRATVPSDVIERKAALAALICAASQCAAAPGHTAQPFQPTKGAAKFLFEAWRRDVWGHVEIALTEICSKHARTVGRAEVSDAQSVAERLTSADLAFIDPPYSGVHYSRFYHVLETIAQGTCGEVSGVGRYPDPSKRPKSDFSLQTKSKAALDKLLATLSERRVRTIVTFPKEETSNGLSGPIVQGVAESYFDVTEKVVNGRFSTLGGNLENRKARIPAYEVILVLSP